jgi:hypothetical protein
MRLAKTAWRRGYRGPACIVVIAWDTGFSLQDVSALCYRHLSADCATSRAIFDRSKDGCGKTGLPETGTLSKFGDWIVRRYLDEFGAAHHEDGF